MCGGIKFDLPHVVCAFEQEPVGRSSPSHENGRLLILYTVRIGSLLKGTTLVCDNFALTTLVFILVRFSPGAPKLCCEGSKKSSPRESETGE